MDCNSSRCEYSIFHHKGCRDPGCIKVRFYRSIPALLSNHSNAPLLLLLSLSLSLCRNHPLSAASLPFADSITAPKYKKSSTRSTMTALHVAPRPRAPPNDDDAPHVFLASLRPMTLPTREHDHTPLITGPNSNSIISMGFSTPPPPYDATLLLPAVRLVTHTYTQRPNKHDLSMCI
jgi:hypothetical protein